MKIVYVSIIPILLVIIAYQALKPSNCIHDHTPTSTDVAKEGYELMQYYAGKYVNDLDLVECYSLMSGYSRNRIGTTKLLELHSLYTSDFYLALARKAKYEVKPTGVSKGRDSLIFEVNYEQVDFASLVSNILKSEKRRVDIDTVSWIKERVPQYLDTATAIARVSKKHHYLITADKFGRLLVSPADPSEYF